MKKRGPSTNGARTGHLHAKITLDTYLTPFTEINSKWINKIFYKL